MRDVAERRQQLEHQHEKALQALQKKKDEVRQLQQAQAEARKEHEGAVQLLEARVRELENQCRSHTEQFNFLSQELSQFRLQTGKLGLPSTSSFCSSLVTSEIVFATCQSSPQHSDGFKQKGPEIVPVSPRSTRKVLNEEVERFSPVALRFTDPVVSPVARSPDTSSPPVASKKAIKKLEAQSSSSRSESMHNSPKSCPTPEVDTASEMEELDIDSISLVPEQENHDPVKLQVFLARYSYNPFDGPNENPEAELPLTAGEYIYVYGEMDEDGFFEGELMDGRRGLVPSNFVERLADDDLVTFLPQELHDLSQSSPLERSFLSISVSSGDRSDYSLEELNASTAPSRLEGDQGEGGISIVVPYPRKVTLIKQFASSLLVTWDPPLVPSGSCLDIQSYNVYVDSELRENVKANSQMKAMIDKLDLKTKAYRVSIQSVSEKGSSDILQCTFLVGCGFVLAPSQLQVRSVKATSVELSWMSSNSNFPHTIYLNGGACDIVKAGIYWYTFHNLNPNTSYIATVEVQPQQTFWKPFPEVEEQVLSTEIQFTTSLAGSPDAPLDVRVDPGPTSGILVISWLPVTIDAEGSSNGVRVTGYAVYADGQKVMEVTSPTAGSVLIEISQLQILQLCQEVTVRTVSLYGESVDSVPAQIPLALLEEVDRSSASQLHCHPSRLLGGEAQALLVTRTSQVPGKELPSATKNSVAKLTLQPSITSEKSWDHVHSETSSNIKASLTPTVQAVSPEIGTLPREEENYLLPPASSVVKEDLDVLRKATQEESGEDNQELLLTVTKPEPHVSDNNASSLETSESCSAEQETNAPSEREPDNNQISLGTKILTTDRPSMQEEDGTREMGQNEGQTPESLVETSGRMKLLKEGSKDDSSQLVPRIRREQGEKRTDPGNRSLNLLTDHNRGSDLSDITEEEEEEDEKEEEEEKPVSGRPGEMKRNPSEYCSRENGDKMTSSPGLLDSTSYQSPVQRSRRSVKKSQGGSAPLGGTIGTWRSPSLESADDKGSARLFVALFDYDPVSMSPNRDTAEEELPFQEGQILKVYGHKDADGFYRGECAGRSGFIPCNMVSELRVDNDSARKQLLEEGHIATDMLMESLGNGALSPPPLHPSNRPSKPRRSKKEAIREEDQVPDLEASGKQNPSSEDPVRRMVAIFDYNPQENSPNPDTEVELRFCAGDIVTVLSSMDDDGFYYGEVNGQKGLVPSNFLEALPSDGAQASEPSLGKQRVRKRRIQ